MTLRAPVVAAVLASAVALADGPATPAPPTAAEIKRVLEFHETGKDQGPVLLDLVACLKVDTTRSSPTVYDCLEPVKGPVKKGTVVAAWTLWFCPKGGNYEDVSVQFVHEGTVRRTVDLKVEGGWKTRNFRSEMLNKAGAWEVRALRGGQVLGAVKVEVEDAPAATPAPAAAPAARPGGK